MSTCSSIMSGCSVLEDQNSEVLGFVSFVRCARPIAFVRCLAACPGGARRSHGKGWAMWSSQYLSAVCEGGCTRRSTGVEQSPQGHRVPVRCALLRPVGFRRKGALFCRSLIWTFRLHWPASLVCAYIRK